MKNGIHLTKSANRIISVFSIAIFLIAMKPTIGFAVEIPTSLRTVWENPFTQTTFHPDNEVNSTFYTFPKVIWNGSQYVDYVYNASDMSAGIGSVYVKVCSDHTVFYDPYKEEERISDEHWTVEYYNQSTSSWEVDSQLEETVSSSLNSSRINFDRKTTLSSGSTLDVSYELQLGSRLKISATYCPIQEGDYRLVWTLSGVSATKATWLGVTENVAAQLVNDTSCSSVQFAGDNGSRCLVDWSDAGFFNETMQRWETYFHELQLKKRIADNKCQATVTFGNFNLKTGQPLIMDPTIDTFNSTEAKDGLVEEYGPSYPPSNGNKFVDMNGSLLVGQAFAQQNGGYIIDRSYVSFDTSSISTMAYNMTVNLQLETSWLNTYVNFNLQVWGGNQPVCVGNLTILNGVQPIYGNLTTGSWGTGQVDLAAWSTTDYPGDDTYINFTIPSNQINKVGSTQFEMNSSRDSVYPPRLDSVEGVAFYSGDSDGNEPKLEVSYDLDTMSIPWSYQPGLPFHNETWLYRNVSTSKVVIALFGGAESSFINSIDNPGEKLFGRKIPFLDALIENGFSVFTPLNDGVLSLASQYNAFSHSPWVRDLVIYLMSNNTYTKVFLFGFSAGGSAVGYEIEQDYASRISAAVMNDPSTPDWDIMYKSSIAKVASSFPTSEFGTPSYVQNIKTYYDNEPAALDKEWHNFTSSHGFFDPNCTCDWHTSPYPSGENDSVAVIDWFNAAHPPSVPFTPSGSQLCYAHTSYSYTSGTIDPQGGNLAYNFSWGDGTYDLANWTSSGANVTISHTWNALGSYNVTVRAENGTGSWSPWSPPLTVGVPPPYGVTMKGHCITEGSDVNVQIALDNSPPEYTTPNTFVNLIGIHNFTVNSTDANGHAFKRWSTGENSTTITVALSGTWVAYYGSGHDLAVTDVEPYKTVVGLNYTMNVNVTAGNPGDYNENLTVTLYANATSFTSNTTSVSTGVAFFNITSVWNTIGFAYGNYNLTAQALQVLGENDTSDNNSTSTTIVLSIPGDINGNFKVNLSDLVLLANAYGTTPATGGTPGAPGAWNPNADIDNNGAVSLTDLVILANHYGQHWP